MDKISSGYLCYEAMRDTRKIRSEFRETLEAEVGVSFSPC
jgi:hypothetical protein